VTDRITITKGVTHTPEGKIYHMKKEKKKTRDSPLRGDVGNSPSVSQKVPHWIEKSHIG